MPNPVPRETAPRQIIWTDLLGVSLRQRLTELCLPLPWLGLSLMLYAAPQWPVWVLGALASFMFFLCALRLNHEAIHGNLGLPRAGDITVLHGLSTLMMGSNCSIAWSHMQHHRDALGPGDIEGHCGHMTAAEVLRYGPRFPLDLIAACWQNGGRKWRIRLLRDGVCACGTAAACFWSGQQCLVLHIAAMLVAECLTAFFAVWITHQGTEGTGLAARSQRGPLARLAYLMFYHREHHLYPKVPVSRLPELAQRLDQQVPGYRAAHQPVVPWLDLHG